MYSKWLFNFGLLLVVLASLLMVSSGSGASTSGKSSSTFLAAQERALTTMFVMLKCDVIVTKTFKDSWVLQPGKVFL